MGKSSGQTTGYKYFMDMHFVVSLGRGGSAPAAVVKDGLMQVIAGDRIAWNGLEVGLLTGNGTIQINAPELFGGDEKEGGIVGPLEVFFGAPTQGVSAYLTSIQGAPQSAHRGLFGAVFKKGQVCSNNPYIKPWSFLRRRITGDWAQGACWLEAKAPIPLDGVGAVAAVVLALKQDFNAMDAAVSPETSVGTFHIIGVLPNDIISITYPSGGTYTAWSRWLGYGSGVGYYAGPTTDPLWWTRFSVKNAEGAVTAFSIESHMTAEESFAAAQANGAIQFTGSTAYQIWLPDDVLYNRGGLTLRIEHIRPGTATRYCMNFAHMAYQVITDPENGLGYPTAVIDDAAFTAAANALYAEGLGGNLRWTQQTSIEDFLGIIQDHAGAMLVRDRRTGLFKFKLLRKDYDTATLPVFGPHNCRISGDAQRPSPADTVNELQVTYTDYRTGKEATTTVRNVAAQQAVGRIISKPHSLTGLPTEALAQRCGIRDLDAMSLPLWRFDLSFLRDADTLEPGSVFRFVWPPLGLDIVLRVAGEIDYGNAASGEIRAKCVQDIFSLPAAVYTGSVGAPNTGAPGAPVAAQATLIEAPYIELVQLLPDVAAMPADAGYVGAVAVRPNVGQRDYAMQSRLGTAAFAEVDRGDFAGSCLLTTRLAPLDVNAYITGTVDTDRLVIGKLAMLGEGSSAELVRIDGVFPAMLHLGRGCADTVPKAWPAGTRLWGFEDFSAQDPTQYMDSETVNAKVLPRTASGALDPTLAEILSMTISSRAARPYPPGNVQVNSTAVLDGSTTPIEPKPDPGVAGGVAVPPGATGSLPGGFVGVPYSNTGAFGDPWHDEGTSSYRYVSGRFWPGASVRHGGPVNSVEWLNDVSAIPITAGTYSVAARVETGDGFMDYTQSVVINAKPLFALLDFSYRQFKALTHVSGFSQAVLYHTSVLDCAGWASGKVYCEVNAIDIPGYLDFGVHGASLDNKFVGPSNPGTLAYSAPGTGVYGLAFDTATGSLWVRNSGGWIGGGDPASSTSPTVTGLSSSVNGRFRFGFTGNATIAANFGNAAFTYAVPTGYSGVPMPSVTVPGMFDIQTLPVGTRILLTHSDGQRQSEVMGSMIADVEWVCRATFGKSIGKWQWELTSPRTAGDQRVGVCRATFDRSMGMLGQIGTDDSIGVRNVTAQDPNVLIDVCLGGVYTQYAHASADVGRFTFAMDLSAGTLAIYADGALLRTITGITAGEWFPAASGPFSGFAQLTTAALVYPVATFADWTVTV